MIDPKPQLSRAAIMANVAYYHSQLDALDTQANLLKEQLDHWLAELDKLS